MSPIPHTGSRGQRLSASAAAGRLLSCCTRSCVRMANMAANVGGAVLTRHKTPEVERLFAALNIPQTSGLIHAQIIGAERLPAPPKDGGVS